MGCDIHFFVEKKIGNKWVSVDEWKDYDGWKTVDYKKAFYSNRNYDLFAILANVRNGYGFAGCDTGNGFIPISMPRGLPDNVSQEVGNHSKQYGEDGHSHSYLTVKELLAYDWNQTTKKRGVVSEEEYQEIIDKPKRYAGGVSGRDIVHVTPSQMDRLITHPELKDKDKSYYTTVEWKETYKEAVRDFYIETLPRLKGLGKPNKVRIVFWFDN